LWYPDLVYLPRHRTVYNNIYNSGKGGSARGAELCGGTGVEGTHSAHTTNKTSDVVLLSAEVWVWAKAWVLPSRKIKIQVAEHEVL
jgi:hypothetical protein